MAQHSIIENIHRNTEDWFAVKAAVRGKGVDCPDDTPTAQVAGKIEDIETGGGLDYTATCDINQGVLQGLDIDIVGGDITVMPPDPITEIGVGGCVPQIPFKIILESGLTTINAYAFANSGIAGNVFLPSTVTSVGVEAFKNCSKLTRINFPAAIVNDGTFANCVNLERVDISSNLTEIKYDAFNNCQSLTDIYYAGTQEQWESVTGLANIPAGVTVHYGS